MGGKGPDAEGLVERVLVAIETEDLDAEYELLHLMESWQPMHEPNRLFDVWFDAAGKRALLIAETVAPAFDPDQQRAAIEELLQTFADVEPSDQMQLIISGPGAFSVLNRRPTSSPSFSRSFSSAAN